MWLILYFLLELERGIEIYFFYNRKRFFNLEDSLFSFNIYNIFFNEIDFIFYSYYEGGSKGYKDICDGK